MANANVLNIRRIPGRLVKNPTDLAAAFPHGGTPLGVTRDMEFRMGIQTTAITAEEFGAQQIEYVYAGELAIFAAVLREYDVDAVQQIFPDAVAGTCGQLPNINYNVTGSKRSGLLLSSKSFKLVFSPDALDRDPFVVLYKAIPLVEETSLMALSLSEELGVGVVFAGIPDGTDRVYTVGNREDIIL